MVLLALFFPLLICVFLLVMERLEAALFPPPPVDDGAALVAGSGDGPAVPEPRGPDGVPPVRAPVPLPRDPLPAQDGMPTG